MIDMKKAEAAMLKILREASLRKADKIQKAAPKPTKAPSKYKGFKR